jgi:hypothetical protein
MAVQRRLAWQYVGSTALTGGELLKYSALGQVDLATALTDTIVGVAAEACAAGNVTPQNISILNWGNCPGTVTVIASAAISAGAALGATTGGKVVTVTGNATGTATFEYIVGYAAEAAGAADETIEMLWPAAAPHSLA